ncbi:hypothetical protein PENANT_c014G10849 [Penicillium antarcticum]|uniref:Uncharacterized protein n=1 Tax=Penicillium antarcticum TaxID=416450 RepID=A0A1V6Q3Y0_9EURO|nr:hypothetical protein PENANT_c014G10849 [Penicillium antarcticum]
MDSFKNSLKDILLSALLSKHLIASRHYISKGQTLHSDRQGPPLDRLVLGQFRPGNSSDPETDVYLFKTSSSVMLTLVVPEESFSKEEEIGLIESPHALWTVLIANGPTRFALDYEPLEHLSPCAQFLRGVLNDRLQELDDDSLFDDEAFTKSKLYHWAIRMCHELSGSVASNLAHFDKVLDVEVTNLIHKAHVHEKLGLSHWSKKLKDEINELGRLQAEIELLREKAQESRNALHGATAVMEARSALKQGERIQTLTALVLILIRYDSLENAFQSLYSMSVFPSSATFASFFAVLAIAFAFTLLLGINLSRIRTIILLGAQDSNLWLRISLAPFRRIKAYVESYVDELGALKNDESSIVNIRSCLVAAIRDFLVPEIHVPLTLWNRFRYRNNPYVRYGKVDGKPCFLHPMISPGHTACMWLFVE